MLARLGHQAELAATGVDAPAAMLARAAADRGGTDRVLAVGGDGTVAEAAAGLLEAGRRIPLGVVPRGTANVLALNLGIPRSLAGAVRIAAEGTSVPIDIGRIDGAPFLISVGTGLHAEMVARADRTLKRRWGVAAYGLAGWGAHRSSTPVRYRLVCDGESVETEATMVQVMNCGALFRTEWELGPGISPVDGVLDVLAYRATTLPQYLTAAAHVVKGTPIGSRLVEHRRATRVTIDADPPVSLQRDGEPAGCSPAEVVIEPRALPVLMPAAGPWAGV